MYNLVKWHINITSIFFLRAIIVEHFKYYSVKTIIYRKYELLL